jgi:hypothetical protein
MINDELVDRMYIATIEAGAAADVAKALLIWALPGAVLQSLGGPRRQLGILFATGLLIQLVGRVGGAGRARDPRRDAQMEGRRGQRPDLGAGGRVHRWRRALWLLRLGRKGRPTQGEIEMRTGILGTLTIGQAPRLDVVPIIDSHLPERRRIHPRRARRAQPCRDPNGNAHMRRCALLRDTGHPDWRGHKGQLKFEPCGSMVVAARSGAQLPLPLGIREPFATR